MTDSMREFGEVERWVADSTWDEPDPWSDAPPMIGLNERRLHKRARAVWTHLRGARALPSVKDLDLARWPDLGAHAVVFDVTMGANDPNIVFLGAALDAQCGTESGTTVVGVPLAHPLLSRLAERCPDSIIARAPIEFEAEAVAAPGRTLLYRSVLLPFSADGDQIDVILGILSWKEVAEPELTQGLAGEVARAMQAAAVPVALDWSEPLLLSLDQVLPSDTDQRLAAYPL